MLQPNTLLASALAAAFIIAQPLTASGVHAADKAAETTAPANTALPVVTVQPHLVDLTFPAEAVIEAVQQSTVGSQTAGRVLEVRADAGQTVKKGEVLMRIDAREASEAAAAAQAQYINAKNNYERTQRLVQQKFLSQSALDKAKADYDAASANRGATAAGQSHATIVSPVNGIVARRLTEKGDMAVPGKPLFIVYEPGSLRATASIPQYRLRELRGVKQARVEFPELGQTVNATSVVVLPTADASTHVSQARATLPMLPPNLAGVVPGMFARVHFVLNQAQKLTVPAGAVVRRGEVTSVYVQAADGRLTLRQVRLGETVGVSEVEVLAGLAAGEKVVTEPVKAGMALRAASAAAK
jgi:RND family efflux transporter MFP subunit